MDMNGVKRVQTEGNDGFYNKRTDGCIIEGFSFTTKGLGDFFLFFFPSCVYLVMCQIVMAKWSRHHGQDLATLVTLWSPKKFQSHLS